MTMRFHHRLFVVMRSFLRRRAVEDELDEELQFHFRQMEAHDAARAPDADSAPGSVRPATRGPHGPDDTHWRTRRQFGGFEQVKEACRDVRPLRSLEYVMQDLRFGARLLARHPMFTVAASLSLALGIGANSAVFSRINGILFRSLPVPQAEQLSIAETPGSDAQPRFAYPTFEAARALIGAHAELAAVSSIQPMQIAAPVGSGVDEIRSDAKAMARGAYVSQWGRVHLVSASRVDPILALRAE